MFSLLSEYAPAFLAGTLVTFKLAVIAWTSGLVFGTLTGYLGSRIVSLSRVLQTTNFFLGSVPIIVFLFWVHYPMQAYLGRVIDPFWSSALIFSLVNLSLVSSTIENSVRSVPKEFIECARVYGLNQFTTFFRIELPLVLRASVPALLKIQVTVLHLTLFASLISVEELFRTAQRINSLEYKPIELYTLLGGFYLAISLPLNLFAYKLNQKYARDFSER